MTHDETVAFLHGIIARVTSHNDELRGKLAVYEAKSAARRAQERERKARWRERSSCVSPGDRVEG